jgi:hypothetical protein
MEPQPVRPVFVETERSRQERLVTMEMPLGFLWMGVVLSVQSIQGGLALGRMEQPLIAKRSVRTE